MKRSFFLGFFLSFLLAVAMSAAAQPALPLTFRTLTTEQGLSENSVYCMAQDPRGFLWLGTQDGLNRYDGASFKVLRNDPQVEGSLSSNFVLSMAVDKQGFLWVGTGGGGLNRYNPITGRFQVFKHEDGRPGTLADNFVRAVFCDRSGQVWAGTEGGLHRFDSKTGRFQLFQHPVATTANVRRNSVRAITQDAAGQIWVGTGAGQLSRLDVAAGQLQARPNWQAPSGITTLCVDQANGLWVGTEVHGLRFLSLSKGHEELVYRHEPGHAGSLSSDAVRSVLEDTQGRLWVGTDEGLHQLDRVSNTFAPYRAQLGRPHMLPENTVQALFQDRNGQIWVGTEGGVASFMPRPATFTTVPITPRPDPVWAVCEDKSGRLWAGTQESGLVCYNPATGQRQEYRHRPGAANSLSENFIRALCFDLRGQLWVGTQRSGLDCLDPATGKVRHFAHNPADPTSLSDNAIRAIALDPTGQLWISTENGLNLFDPNTGRSTVYRDKPLTPKASFGTNYIRMSFRDRQGRLWVGTGGGGLCLLDPRTGLCKPYRNVPGQPRSLSSNFVRGIVQDRAGTLWIGTEGGGLNRLDDAEKGLFTTFREPQGLPNDVVYALLPDRQGNLWLSTNKGIAHFSPTTLQVRTYDMRDGLAQDEFNAGSQWAGSDGRLYFGGITGLITFRPGGVPVNQTAPPVVFTGFRKFNQQVRLDTSITERRTLRLGPRENFFSIEFAALNFQLPSKNSFMYRLRGFDEDWIEAGARHEATYTNLDPGTYLFQVRAANNDGVWNQKGATLKIVVTPPWYQTWWFRVLASWLLIGLLFLAYRVRVRQLLALERVRHNIARDLHDDMGSTLSSIGILSTLARNHQHQNRPEQATQLLDQISESSRRMLDSMDDIVWAINPAHDSMEAVLSRMRIFASDVLEARGIDFSFTVAPDVQGLRLEMRARREFFLLYKESVNNLAKYAQCEEARIHLDYQYNRLTLTVEDNGVGFDPKDPAKGGGNGLTNMRARAAALRGQLDIVTAPGQGTKLELSVPLKAA
ncbi:hypothetical protein HER32_13695 [Hymenobacter sp. BT18]|uniref:sensor histidine kinase n=1 Tax=Hymenobacter sp. BT18 TaxID=2835648 RepID=UPI00143E99BE|nr:sensor histidine kinase [Hymenobacter sp. BT18]QIX62178.1 hypothetical protein HER32_13695 [Hymenobacter sp. BT18]